MIVIYVEQLIMLVLLKMLFVELALLKRKGAYTNYASLRPGV